MTAGSGGFRNVYLDGVVALGDAEDGDRDSDVQEAAWEAAVEAAPLLVGEDEKISPEELFERLKPFKDRVAEDIREDG